jgi:hypothetical protein
MLRASSAMGWNAIRDSSSPLTTTRIISQPVAVVLALCRDPFSSESRFGHRPILGFACTTKTRAKREQSPNLPFGPSTMSALSCVTKTRTGLLGLIVVWLSREHNWEEPHWQPAPLSFSIAIPIAAAARGRSSRIVKMIRHAKSTAIAVGPKRIATLLRLLLK